MANPLLNVPGLGGFLAGQQQQQAAEAQELQQAATLQGLLQRMRAQQQEEQMRAVLAGSGGDPEKAIKLALSSGNVAAAEKLAPLAKMAQERRQADETRRGVQELFAPQPAPQQNPMVPGPYASIMAGSGDVVPAAAPAANPAGSRKEHLQKLAVMYANNPTMMRLVESELGKLEQTPKPTPEPEKWSDPYQLGGATVQKNLTTGQIRTAVARPPAASAAAAAVEIPTGLSEQYKKDPAYKANVDFWAKYMKDGGTLPPRFAQSGAGKKMMPDILNVVPTLGGDGREILANQVELTGQKAQARSAGTRSAAVAMAAGEAREMMPILIATSENFKRTGYQPINRVLKAYQDNTGSIESRQFGAALNTFINVYARAISPSGVPTVSDKDHAREVLSTADSHEQLLGLLKVLDQEMTAALNAPRRVRDEQRSEITGAPNPHAAPRPDAPLTPTERARLEELRRRRAGGS